MEKRNYIPSFLIAYLLCIGGLNQLMGIMLDRSEGIMMMSLVPVAGLLAIHFVMSNKSQDLNLNKRALFFVYYIVSLIVLHKYAYRYSTFEYIEALIYCFIPIYISFYKIDVEKVLKYITFFSVLVLPVSEDFFKNVGQGSYETIGMSTTYNVLPFIIATALHFWYYRKKAGFLMWCGYAVNVYYLIKAIFYGNRGPIISLMVFVILIYLHKFDLEGNLKKNTIKTVMTTLLVGGVTIYVVNNINDIILGLYKWLNSFDIQISAITKSVHKISSGDLSNGRNDLFAFVLDGIKEHYIIGNGIGTILYNSGGRHVYPHNIFLQLWYDLGVFLSLPMFCLIWKATKKTFFESAIKKDYAVILMLLFTLSMPRLCYSSELWGNIPFWFLIMFTVSPNLYENM